MTLPGPFWRLWSAQGLSLLGSQLQYIALPLWVLHLTGSPVATGLAFATETLPVVLLAPWAGYLADRYDRRLLLVGCEVLSAAGVGALLLATRADALPLVYLSALAIRVCNTVGTPAAQAIVRVVVPAPALPRASSAFEAAFGAVTTIGPVVGAVLYAAVGLTPVLALNLASFVLGGLLASALPPCPGQPRLAGPRGASAEVLRAAAGRPVVVRVGLAEAAYFLCFGGSTALCVLIAQAGLGDRYAGLYPAGLGLGWLLASVLVIRRYGARAQALVRIAAWACAPIGLLLWAGAGLTLASCVLGGVLAGAVNVLVAGGATVAYQTETAAAEIGRLFALRRALVNSCLAASTLALPALSGVLGLGRTIALAGVLATAAMLTALAARQPAPVLPERS